MPGPPKLQPPLTPAQASQKEAILTQSDPSGVDTIEAVVLKQGELFLLTDDCGNVPPKLPHGFGLYFEDCRFLDTYVLTLNGTDLTPLSYSATRGYETVHELANPDLPAVSGGRSVPKTTIAVHRHRIIRGCVLHEHLTLHNYGSRPARLRIDLRFRAGFEDMFVLKGFVHEPRGVQRPPAIEARDRVELGYDGADGYSRTTTLAFDPPPTLLGDGEAFWQLDLQPHERYPLSLAITPSEHRTPRDQRRAGSPSPIDDPRSGRLHRSESVWMHGAAIVKTSNPLFNSILERSLLDLRLLRSRLHGQHYFAAGVPWFATLFGRDAAITALQTLPYGASVARETLRLLARYQAQSLDPYRDAEPGKILHEYRTGELAQLGVIPQSPAYYGTVDATLLFLILMAAYLRWTGDLPLVESLRPNIDAALRWISDYADHDGDGFIDYVGEHPNGIVNQGWKDSGNAIVDAHGKFAVPPIALCEVQAYAYRAWRDSAAMLRALGDADRADELEKHAEAFRARFERAFWSDELGCYALTLHNGGQQAAVVSSNAGQVLWGAIASPSHAAAVATRLLKPDMFSGWGIRTLSSQAAAYNPMGYHLGSVWPHDNGLIIAGLRRYGHDRAALRVFAALVDAAASFRDDRLPELFCGFPRQPGHERPVRYPVACSPQAWAAGAIPHALWTILGLRPNALEGVLHIIRPRLPDGIDWLKIERVRVGSALVNLRFERISEDGTARVRPNLLEGPLNIEITPHPRPHDF